MIDYLGMTTREDIRRNVWNVRWSFWSSLSCTRILMLPTLTRARKPCTALYVTYTSTPRYNSSTIRSGIKCMRDSRRSREMAKILEPWRVQVGLKGGILELVDVEPRNTGLCTFKNFALSVQHTPPKLHLFWTMDFHLLTKCVMDFSALFSAQCPKSRSKAYRFQKAQCAKQIIYYFAQIKMCSKVIESNQSKIIMKNKRHQMNWPNELFFSLCLLWERCQNSCTIVPSWRLISHSGNPSTHRKDDSVDGQHLQIGRNVL